ncbi:hypothetical protein Pmar_PMAR021341 [Perkinsus marinus ATCC 50983]|uniref:Uncharacterized protein n=1 Tax=Perkinsus marinus (strain ATCC 50983 / TXsc) TaxID=423536 RepID=C5KMB3_PERM5|nr:hypothetical protein Pmar_PMAR021341 [Perkinsus marinus ATCC 50983]EER14367.1 hypothetical protein Pmar_PMAR021341 [Perkinsus marinus ATCC 50983]|eukprot:XP_002782572.1 hypothetical protein Pmar_PMAR021341 [Perkinsus marinus ATCC 50983]
MVLGRFSRRNEANGDIPHHKTHTEENETIAGSDLSSPKSDASSSSLSSPYLVNYVQTTSVSEGRHGREMGDQVQLLTNVIGSVVGGPSVHALPTSQGGLFTQHFPAMLPIASRTSAYLVLSLTCGQLQITTLHKFTDQSATSTLADLSESDLTELLESSLAFVLQPTGSALRHLPVKGPKDADPIAKAFGKEACSIRRYTHSVSGATVFDLCIDLFSMRIVRHLFPKLAFSKGRQTDIFVTNFTNRTCLCAFRLEATDSLLSIVSG